MKYKFLKTIPMLLMAASIMTGCGNNISDDSATTESTTAAAEETVEETSTDETTTAAITETSTTTAITTTAAQTTTKAAVNKTPATPPIETPAAGSLSLSYKNTKITLNTNIANVKSALGETTDYSEAPSCNYNGLDKVFTYDGVSIYTYPHQSGDLINEIEVNDASLVSDKGIAPIGKSISDIKAAYGEPTSVEGSTYKYANGNCYTYFYADGDSVSYWGIAYEA